MCCVYVIGSSSGGIHILSDGSTESPQEIRRPIGPMRMRNDNQNKARPDTSSSNTRGLSRGGPQQLNTLVCVQGMSATAPPLNARHKCPVAPRQNVSSQWTSSPEDPELTAIASLSALGTCTASPEPPQSFQKSMAEIQHRPPYSDELHPPLHTWTHIWFSCTQDFRSSV